jgi:hypothetical protein
MRCNLLAGKYFQAKFNFSVLGGQSGIRSSGPMNRRSLSLAKVDIQ